MSVDLGNCTRFRWVEREPGCSHSYGFRDIMNHKMLAFGHFVYLVGKASTLTGDEQTHMAVLNTATFEWTSFPVAVDRKEHVAFAKNDKIYVLGGLSSDGHSPPICLDIITQSCTEKEVYGVNPFPRSAATGEYVERLDVFVLFGGIASDGLASNHLLHLHAETMEWIEPMTKGMMPAPRCEHCSCWAGDSLYVFGGRDRNMGYFGDIFICRERKGSWNWSFVRDVHDGTLYGSSMTYTLGRIFIFGGTKENSFSFATQNLYVYSPRDDDLHHVPAAAGHRANSAKFVQCGALARSSRYHDMIRLGSRLLVTGGPYLSCSVMELSAEEGLIIKNTPRIVGSTEVFPAESSYVIRSAVSVYVSEKQKQMLRDLRSFSWDRQGSASSKFMVDLKWFKTMKDYVFSGGVDEHPGPVTNSVFFEDHLFYERFNVHNMDYIVVTEAKWNMLMKWFGGGPALKKTVKPNGTDIVRSFPLRGVCSTNLNVFHRAYFEETQTVGDVHRKFCELFHLDMDTTRTYDYFRNTPHARLDIKPGTSLIESNLRQQNYVLLEVPQDDGSYVV